jgi:methionyl aminopeptidase
MAPGTAGAYFPCYRISMSIKSDRDLLGLRAIGKIVGLALREMAAQVRPGITTAELDAAGARVLARHGARSAPPLVYGFPADVCISINDEAIHGIPGARTVQAGDLVKLDLVAQKDGYMADAAVTVAVPPVSDEAQRLVACAERAFYKAMAVARARHRVFEIGRAVEAEVKRSGFSVMRELCGHGVGRSIHEEPQVPNYEESRARQRLTEGLVITVEPIIAARAGRGVLGPDRWTIRTADGGWSAHYEHTIAITWSEPILLTAA